MVFKVLFELGVVLAETVTHDIELLLHCFHLWLGRERCDQLCERLHFTFFNLIIHDAFQLFVVVRLIADQREELLYLLIDCRDLAEKFVLVLLALNFLRVLNVNAVPCIFNRLD